MPPVMVTRKVCGLLSRRTCAIASKVARRISVFALMGSVVLLGTTSARADGAPTKRAWLEDFDPAIQRCRSVYDIAAGSGLERSVFGQFLLKTLGGEPEQVRTVMSKIEAKPAANTDEARMLRLMRCVTDSLTTTSANPFVSDPFYGLDVRIDKGQLSQLGASIISDQSDVTWGTKTVVDALHSHPANTLSTWLFFHSGYGLYRVLFRIGDAGNNLLTADRVGWLWTDLGKKIAAAGGQNITAGTPITTLDGLTFSDLRQCPKGTPDERRMIAGWSDAEMNTMRSQLSSVETKFIFMRCGLIPEPRVEFTYPGWPSGKKIILAMAPTTVNRGTVNLVLVDMNVAELVVQEHKSGGR